MQIKFKKLMNQAGDIFSDIKLYRQSAMCYFSSGNVQGSANSFEKQGKYGQAAQCYVKLNDLQKAAELFVKAKLFANAFECYERTENWDALMKCLHKNKDHFSATDRQALVDKYFPIALNSVQ